MGMQRTEVRSTCMHYRTMLATLFTSTVILSSSPVKVWYLINANYFTKDYFSCGKEQLTHANTYTSDTVTDGTLPVI